MNNLFIWLFAAAGFCVVLSLVIGVFYMTREGIENRQKSLKMMKLRLYLQGAAIVMIIFGFMAAGD